MVGVIQNGLWGLRPGDPLDKPGLRPGDPVPAFGRVPHSMQYLQESTILKAWRTHRVATLAHQRSENEPQIC